MVAKPRLYVSLTSQDGTPGKSDEEQNGVTRREMIMWILHWSWFGVLVMVYKPVQNDTGMAGGEHRSGVIREADEGRNGVVRKELVIKLLHWSWFGDLARVRKPVQNDTGVGKGKTPERRITPAWKKCVGV
jgi:hypothetical protein